MSTTNKRQFFTKKEDEIILGVFKKHPELSIIDKVALSKRSIKRLLLIDRDHKAIKNRWYNRLKNKSNTNPVKPIEVIESPKMINYSKDIEIPISIQKEEEVSSDLYKMKLALRLINSLPKRKRYFIISKLVDNL